MIKLKLNKKDIVKLNKLYKLHTNLIKVGKKYKELKRHYIIKILKDVTPKLPDYIYDSVYEHISVLFTPKGINLYTYCKVYDKTINIKGLGYFDIEKKEIEDKPVLRYLLIKSKNSYSIYPIYITKQKSSDMIGIDVGSERTFITSDGHIVKHVNTEKDMKLYLKTKDKQYLTNIQEKRDKVVDAVVEYYASRYKNIAIEDLHTRDKEFLITPTLFKYNNERTIDQAIKRQSWHMLFDKLEKREDLNVYRVPPEYTSQICSKCGVLNKKSRNKTVWHCKSCGYECDADINAAINIKERGEIVKAGGKIDLNEYRRISRKNKHKNKHRW